ncbi:SDR family oxidoreductase [Xanthomonas campestris pv. badrii]|uniref:SDR family oxidoreductase n=1 Tax=Xanthomonas campestris pv. badrii TaxID=149696 RepID=A0A7Z2V7G5_XANCA|nr:SDR family oxidoreductase [Xanthomonas campestris]MCC4605443.1 SDR family oxidoreductase [Xanthomonas campestris pv. parthenii]QJD66469.1 SDR family oxidoreductase [Xanthomonas campestris pv. badrii]
MSKTWLITGASAGLGRLLTERLLARGEKVAATVRRPQVLQDLAARHPDTLCVYTMDLTDTQAIHATVEQAFADFGRIDILVSNAGYGVLGTAEDATDAQVRHIIDTNLVGSIALIRAALPHLRKQGGGHVLQLSSEGGQIAYPGFSLYHASKWGIEGFVEALSKELAPFDIKFTLVEPGPTATNFVAGTVRPALSPAYAGTPADQVRSGIDSGAFAVTGDAGKVVLRMIEMVDAGHAPLRLTLGASAYRGIRAALLQRLAELEAQQAIAESVELSDEAAR